MLLEEAEREWKKTKLLRLTAGRTGVSETLRTYFQSDEGHVSGQPSLVTDFPKEYKALNNLRIAIGDRIKSKNLQGAAVQICLLEIAKAIDNQFKTKRDLNLRINSCLRRLATSGNLFLTRPSAREQVVNDLRQCVNELNHLFMPSNSRQPPMRGQVYFTPSGTAGLGGNVVFLMQMPTKLPLLAAEILKHQQKNSDNLQYAIDEMQATVDKYNDKWHTGL